MRQRYSALLEDIHKVLDEGTEKHRTLGISIKKEAMRLGLHRDLNLDSISSDPYTTKELERLDAFTEEIANEKILGAYYTMNEPYSDRDLLTTTLAVAADRWHTKRPARTVIKVKSPQNSCKTSPI